MRATLVKFSIKPSSQDASKLVFIEFFDARHRKVGQKQLLAQADLLLELDNICKIRRIRKLSQLNIQLNCNRLFQDSVICRMIRLLQSLLQLLQDKNF